MDLWWVIIAIVLGAVLGDTVNYWIGNFLGLHVFLERFPTLVKHEHIDRTYVFYEKYGGLTIFVARFVPVVRTFAPFLAGIGSMNYKRFLFYNVLGADSWTLLVVLMEGTFSGPLPSSRKRLTWSLEADEPVTAQMALELKAVDGSPVAHEPLRMLFLPPVVKPTPPYIPEPKPVPTDPLIGAHHCPLWESDKPNMWLNVLKHPERTPALGFYSQENPEVADWETKWAVEHGISFFIYCWYRTSQGGAVKTQFGSAIHDALFKSRFADKMKFTLMWENQSRDKAGVADERDLFTHLLPYWLENYFKHPSYLKVDNKPVLFIYRPEFLVDDLGGVNVAKAFSRMREVCREAGFDGLYLLGEYRGTEKRLQKRQLLG